MKKEERIKYFDSGVDRTLVKIIACAVVFHMLVVAVCIGLHYVNLKPEPEKIPVFEMVKLPAPAPRPRTPPKPKMEQPKPETPKPTEPPKPKVNKELPPEIKPEPEEVPEEVHETEPTPEPEPEPEDDFDVDDMDLPTAIEAPSLDPVGSVDMDPLMQVYLEQLKKIIMSNFKPPKDLKVGRDAKTTVQFAVDRFGGISGILLKRSSGIKVWDHLSMRAIQISKVPELPPNYRAPNLVLHFNFTPN